MGCAPSLHVSSTGVVSCREEEEEEVCPTANHQPTPTTVTATATTAQNQHQGPGGRQQVTQAWDLPAQPLRLVTGSSPHLGTMRGLQRQLKVLLVFPREDSVFAAWRTASQRQGHSITTTNSQDSAVRACQEGAPDLVIVDARPARGYTGAAVCGALRQTEGGQLAVVVGVVKRSFADRENATVGPMLKAGFNRVLTESTSVGTVLNDLIQIEHSDIASQMQVCASQAVLSALDACREVVHITDTQHRIKYINKACEGILGYTLDEVVDRSLWDIHTADAHRQDGRPSATDLHHYSHHRPSLEFRSAAPQPDATPGHRQILEQVTDHHHHHPHHRVSEGKVPLDITEAVNMQMRRGKEWEGVVTCRRRSGGTLHLPSRVIPVAPLTRLNQFYVYLSDTHLLEFSTAMDHFHPRGSIKSLRKGSHDIRSLSSDAREGGGSSSGGGGIIRRQSLVKLHSLTIEAPITRVFSIIAAAQDNSPAYVAQALEKAMEILRSTELYSPQLVSTTTTAASAGGGGGEPMGGGGLASRQIVPADPVATDLLGGLLAQGPKPLLSGRRSSNDTVAGGSAASKANHHPLPRPSLPALHQHASGAIRELLAEDMSWNFDIFKLEQITDKRPLVWLGMSLMCRFDVPDTLGCDENTLQNWLTLIEANYHADNSYHNSTHAADVLHSTAYFLNRERIKQLLDPLDVAACLVAAVVHDVDHPGKNSAFLCNTNNELAILYNDLSVLESHHVAVSFKHTRSDDRVNIFKALDRDTYKHIRKCIIDMVLATDMTRHFEHLSKFVNMAGVATMTSSTLGAADDDGGVFDDDPMGPSPDLLSFGSPENLVIIKRMLIKCADVSNPLRPLHLSIDWAYRIANEYFNQTEEEKQRVLPIVMPQFDRTTCSIPKSQIGFIDFFINDMFNAWDALADIPELLDYLRANYLYWKEQEETGVTAPPPPPPPPPPPGMEEEEQEEKGMIKEEEVEEEKGMIQEGVEKEENKEEEEEPVIAGAS